MKTFRTISKLNITFQFVIWLLFVFSSLISISILKLPFSGIVLLAVVIVLWSILTVYKAINSFYKIEFNDEITLKGMFKETKLKYYEIRGMTESKFILENRKIPLWYPVSGKGMGSTIDGFDEIFNFIKKHNPRISTIKRKAISAQNWIIAGIIGLLTTLLIFLSGIIPNQSNISIRLLFAIYFGNVIVIALLLHMLRKKA
jgi:hypothetical protein